MKSGSYVNVNNVGLKELSYNYESLIEGYLLENPDVLLLNHFKSYEGLINQVPCKRSDGGGRSDILISYDNEYQAVIEIKNECLTKEAYDQLCSYFIDVSPLIDKIKLDINNKININKLKWIGVLVGTDIDDDILEKIGKNNNSNFKLAAIVLKRFKDEERNQTYTFSDIYFYPRARDNTTYFFNNEKNIPQSKLALKLFLSYVDKNKGVSFGDLQKFASIIKNPTRKVLRNYEEELEYLKSKNKEVSKSDYWLDDILSLKDGTRIVVSGRMRSIHMEDVLRMAEAMGFEVIPEV